MMRRIIWILLEIYFSFEQWKNFENPLRTDKVIGLYHEFGVLLFWDTVYRGPNFGNATAMQIVARFQPSKLSDNRYTAVWNR